MPERKSVPKAPNPAHDQERFFRDAEGVFWRASIEPHADYDRRRGASLIFASETVVRRVRGFPADWWTLSDEELIALSWKV